MSLPYTGNSVSAQSPSPAPSLGNTTGGDPIGSLPADGDPDAASTFNQAYKVALDWIAFFRRVILSSAVTLWNSATVYSSLEMVLSPGDGNTHRVKSGHTSVAGVDPASGSADWEEWALTRTQVMDLLPVTIVNVSATGVSASAGATLGTVIQTQMGTSPVLREVMGTVTIPLSGGSGWASILLTGSAAFGTGIFCRIANNSDSTVTPAATVSCYSGGGPQVVTIVVTGCGSATSITVSFRLSGY